MLTRIDHIDLKVPELTAAVEFLHSMGLVTVRVTDQSRGSVELSLPGPGQVVFELREDPSLTQTTLNHIAFASDDPVPDVQALVDSQLPVTKAHALIKHSGRTISNVSDPSGTTWQITETSNS